MRLTATGRLIFILIGMILFVGSGLIAYSFFKSKTAKIPSTFEECEQTPGSILSASYPAVCMTKTGQRFVQPLSEEEKKFLNPPEEPTSSPYIPSGWLTYRDTEYGISFSYPSDWQLDPENHNIFSQGEIINLQILGETSVALSVAKPVPTDLSLEDWIDSEFIQPQLDVLTRDAKLTYNSTLGNQNAVQVQICQQGDCNSFRFAKIGNQIYGIEFFTEKATKPLYMSQIDQIISSYNINSSVKAGPITSDKCLIGGCNGEICQNASDEPIASICLYLEEFECYKNAECTVQAEGNCGWTQSEELLFCLNSKKSTTY
ncbi:hypothetical protein A3I51_01610 [Candidatus Gottesmanbacteria bacterium RIFCSPLOWO2_02_FULL_38_8]|uniref:Uncharacterized protein n=1 Tax=Candidatus Gottesmanbacteria bacterium RIFCSPLOWO2_02_FULL_38_8 TaxID=1798397 RepID=A0A1F6B5M8_9BACT|nr:MAG: hypothetical protein A3I51_01610 [Candidatus Gottesmanbacteria bacterium RIFCSPLOWO2_02_FULL_38_8]